MTKKDITPKTLEQLLREKAESSYTICSSNECPLRQSCLHWMAREYSPKHPFVVSTINLMNPLMQTDQCPMYRSSKPIRMPLGISKMYYDMPRRIEVALKRHLINHFNRKRYYEYHSGYRPLPPEHEQYIRLAALRYGWPHPLEFNGYTEDYLW